MNGTQQTIVQCDFDGTVTKEDISFVILEAFAKGNWKQSFRDYQEGKISVGHFNTIAFSTIKADKESLLEITRRKTEIRPGFRELIACCRRKNFRFVIVSNGLHFYIEDILKNLGMPDIEVYAAQTDFHPDGLQVQYIGPEGQHLDNNFKIAYTDTFLIQGYRVIYIGDGESDLPPAKKAHHIFATGTLLELCRETNLDCTPFIDHNQVISALESWK
ncbi:MtnX-like HAD-IB family phosphatase [Chloroflexota bacterium]